MPSTALVSLQAGLQEINDLQRANPTPVGAPPAQPALARVIGRASVVLLYSHFERYFYAVNEEASLIVNRSGTHGDSLPERLSLRHSRLAVNLLSQADWPNRAEQLRSFISSDAWLWESASAGALTHDRLLDWMISPDPKNIRAYYALWGIDDIFDVITRTAHHKSRYILSLKTLVEKRHNIAHGDASESATQADVRQYRDAVREFCARTDRYLARLLSGLLNIPRPW